MLGLKVAFEGDVVPEIVVEAAARGVDGCIGADVLKIITDDEGADVVDFASADEEVGIGVETVPGILNLWPDEEVFLGGKMAVINGIGAAGFDGGLEVAKSEEGEIDARGEAGVFAAVDVNEGAGYAGKGGELELLGCGGQALSGCSGRREDRRDEQGQAYHRLSKLHSAL